MHNAMRPHEAYNLISFTAQNLSLAINHMKLNYDAYAMHAIKYGW